MFISPRAATPLGGLVSRYRGSAPEIKSLRATNVYIDPRAALREKGARKFGIYGFWNFGICPENYHLQNAGSKSLIAPEYFLKSTR